MLTTACVITILAARGIQYMLYCLYYTAVAVVVDWPIPEEKEGEGALKTKDARSDTRIRNPGAVTQNNRQTF